MQIYSPRLARNVPLLIFKKQRFISTVQWTLSDAMPVTAGHRGMFLAHPGGRGGFLRVVVVLHLHREREGGC